MSARVALLAAGGTGGHLFPAEALAVELIRRGFAVDLATDERADQYGSRWPGRDVHIVPADTVRSKNPLALLRTAATLARGTFAAWSVIGRTKPAIVVGFGGYPSIPPIFAANLRGVPTILHEANAVMGRANRGLAERVTAIATSWPTVRHADAFVAKVTETGMPVRPAVRAAAEIPYAAPAERIRLLVFGGSQGAAAFADLVPPAVAGLDATLRARLDIVQQVRAEDAGKVRAAYDAMGVAAELAPFFRDLPERMAAAHLVVSRSGASSVAELAVVGRPSLMIPFPHAIDNDQLRNAQAMEAAGGGVVAEQKTLSEGVLSGHLGALLSDPARLTAMAAAAKTLGKPDAVERLADLAERIAG